MTRKLDADQRREVAEQYAAWRPVAAIAEDYGITTATVCKVAFAAGVPKHGNSDADHERVA